MQLLPLVEMYCKWVLEEDCSNLRALMLRFDNERELESHELGQSLLMMLRDDDDNGLDRLPSRIHSNVAPNPFDAIRAGLAAVDIAFRGIQPQVHAVVELCGKCNNMSNKFYGILGKVESGLHVPLNHAAVLDNPLDLQPLSAIVSFTASTLALCCKFVPAVPVVDVWLRMLLGFTSPLLSVTSSASCLCPLSRCFSNFLKTSQSAYFWAWDVRFACLRFVFTCLRSVSETGCGRTMPTACANAHLQPCVCATNASLSLFFAPYYWEPMCTALTNLSLPPSQQLGHTHTHLRTIKRLQLELPSSNVV